MKLTKSILKGIIREELKSLNERTVRLSTFKDANFQPGQFVQILGKKGMVKLDKKSVHKLAKIVRQLSGKKGMGWSFTMEGKLTEGISVADTRFVGKFVIHILSSGSEMRSAILSKKNNSKYGTRDKKDLKTLWDLAGKYKGKEIKEGKLSEMKVNKGKVNKTFNDVINHMRKSEKKLNEDEWYEMTVQLKKWFNKNVM